MKRPERRNSAESIRTRLLDLAKKRREDFQLTLAHYAIERLLYRLGQSAYRDQFVLKGAVLFVLWKGHLHRPTRDLDLLGYGSPDLEAIAAIFREVSAIADDDGIAFDTTNLRAVRIKEDADYEGVRVSFLAQLAGARIPMQVDVGFGDVVSPVPARFPALLPCAASDPGLPAGNRGRRETPGDGRPGHPQQPDERLLRPVGHLPNLVL